MHPRLPRTLTTAADPAITTCAVPAGLTANVEDRTIEGLVVPYGPAGYTSDGLLTFRAGSVSWHPDATRIKLLVEHDPRRSVGHAVAVEERLNGAQGPGIYARFRIKSGPEGDAALADVDELARDGFSIGVELDAATHDRLRRARAGQAVAAAGRLRENSLVSIPAFEDARGQRGQLVAAAAGGLTRMTSPQTPPATPPADPGHGARPADPAAPSPDPVPTPPATPPTGPGEAPGPVTSAAAGTLTTGAPTPVRAAAGAVTVISEPATYTFDGRGPSLCRDAFFARMEGDAEASHRMARFNAELRDCHAGALGGLMRAAGAGRLTTAAPGDPIASPADTGDVSIPTAFMPAENRADLFRSAVDAGRPLVAQITNKITLTSAAPFLVPFEGEFDGVADHTEGTAHVAEGTLTLRDAPVTPRAVSGAYRVTRELVDASNPAIDRIALRAMLRNYRRHSEQKAVDALETVAPTVANVNTAMELRSLLVNFVDDDGFGADFIAVSKSSLAALFAEVDGDGRPMLTTGGNAPTAMTTRGGAGYTGAGVDGTPIFRVPRLSVGLGYAIRSDGILFAESNVQQFRFEEPEGPGIIKLALWAYVAAAILDEDDVLGFDVDAIV